MLTSRAWLHETFAVSLLQTYPTAIGLMPPLFLRMANKLAPNNEPETDGGVLPSSNRFVRLLLLLFIIIIVYYYFLALDMVKIPRDKN